jgi:Xaa-Pro aminopeptidase
MNERVASPLPLAELERRWAALRAAMSEQGIDVLLAQTNNDWQGGTPKYLTDLPSIGGSWTCVVFPREEPMTIVRMGPKDGLVDPGEEAPGVARIITQPTFPAAPYSSAYEIREVVGALAPWSRATIGIVGAYQMSAALAEGVHSGLPRAHFVDATDMVDAIRAVKSESELELIRRTAALQDAAMARALAHVVPGRREREITAHAQLACNELGAEQGVYLSASFQPGDGLGIGPPHFQDRVLREGDVMHLLVESNGPGGLFTELGRTCVIGEPPQRLVEEMGFAIEAQRFCVDLLKPGAHPAEVWERYNDFLRANGRPEEPRLHAHSQGHDLVERPLVRPEETLPIAAGMNLAVHPTYIKDGFFVSTCDNFIVTSTGGVVPSIHGFSPEVVSVG